MRKLSMEELDRLSVEEFKKESKSPIAIVLDNVRSLNNVGSVFRTADSFLVEKIYLCGITGTPPHKEIQKTALGATESVDWEHVPTTLAAVERLAAEGYIVCAFEQADKSIMLHEFAPRREKKYALVFGNEVFGVEQEVLKASDTVIEIPQLGTKHSLNIAVSVGIAVWDFVFKMSVLKNNA